VAPGYLASALFGTPQFFSAQVGLVPALVKQAGTGAEALVVFTTDDGGRHWGTARAPSDKALALYPAQGTVPFSAATALLLGRYPGPGCTPLATEEQPGRRRHLARWPRPATSRPSSSFRPVTAGPS